MNLNYLSPKIKAMILDGQQLKGLRLQDILYDVPILGKEQEEKWLGVSDGTVLS
ncbi:MAG: hypothetical protein LBI26_02685 [Holosporales bacterium]|jgi:hypothetical protein|nr:hypothetical protein [Holosporales bacterium]